MSRLHHPAALDAIADRVAPPAHSDRDGRSFDLHPALHVGVFGGFGVYLAVMWSAFGQRELIIPFAIFFFFTAAFFVVPAAWARIENRTGTVADWSEFLRDGFNCATGHLSARETMAQVLIMPVMLLLWGLSVAVIRALF